MMEESSPQDHVHRLTVEDNQSTACQVGRTSNSFLSQPEGASSESVFS
jgi:hypothetical protein